MSNYMYVGGHDIDWPDTPVEIHSGNLEEVLNQYDNVVVDCWAPWCVPCKMIAPVVDNLARKYRGKILFGKLNTDTNSDIAMRYGIMSIPTLLIFKKGKLVHRLIGAMPEGLLEKEILDIIGK